MNVDVDISTPGFDGFAAGSRARLAAVAQRARFLMEKRVPMAEGTLRASTAGSDFGSGHVVYDTPYANRQYNLHTSNRTTPGTDGGWDEEIQGGAGHKDLADFAAELVRRDLG